MVLCQQKEQTKGGRRDCCHLSKEAVSDVVPVRWEASLGCSMRAPGARPLRSAQTERLALAEAVQKPCPEQKALFL